MFCNVCGSPVASEQTICSQCGSRTTGVLVANAARRRVAEHIHLLAILWFVLGTFCLIPAVIMGILAAFVVIPLAAERVDKIAMVFGPGVLGVLCVVFLVCAALRFAVGWGLLKMRPWGRTYALVMAFLALICPPFDTALGIYTLYVLLPDAAGDEYRQLSNLASGKAATHAAVVTG